MKDCKLAIVGWRDFDNKNRVWFEISEAIKLLNAKGYRVIEIISGIGEEERQNKGVDFYAREYAKYHHIKYVGFQADWDDFNGAFLKRVDTNGRVYNALAGLNRNTLIVVHSTHVLALPKKNVSRGTYDTISKARKYERRLRIIEL